MPVYLINLDLQLEQDRLMDIFLFQWPTTFSDQGPILPQLANDKATLLKNFRNWLFNYFDNAIPIRPLFIVLPELSMPKCYTNLLDEIARGMNRPTVIIAGLEYLGWDEYHKFIENESASPQPATWFENGDDGCLVNAAGIWIREYSSNNHNGNIKKYLQPKCHPYDHERPYLYPCLNVLVFRSQKQVSGPRLNFCVQICSDFSSASFVRELRQKCVEACSPSGITLDITFLLQHNEDQDAPQIKQAIQAYFEPAESMAETDGGCLIFINRANDTLGKADKWGKSKILFPFQRRWRHLNFASPTFWLKDERANNHQAAILRESGPCLYWLVYKPLHLVNRIAGSGEPVPFPDGKAYYAIIKNKNFGDGKERDDHRFMKLQPICHWFSGELDEGIKDLPSWIERKSNSIGRDVANSYLSSYKQGARDWFQIFTQREDWAHGIVNIYFSACNCNSKNSDRSLSRNCNPTKEPEPQNWGSCTSKAIQQMMQAYSLLLLGASTFPGGKIKPEFGHSHHASDTDKFKIAFMWGCDRHMSQAMITTYLRIYTCYLVNYLCENFLLVLVSPKGTPNPEDMRTHIKNATFSITHGPSPNQVQDHLLQPGDVVMPNVEERFHCICDDSLFGEFGAARDEVDLRNRLQNIIKKYISGG